jgi:hypothetical protein
MIVLPTLWMALDAFKNLSLRLPQRSHEMIIERCDADHVVLWMGLLLLYTLSLCIALTIAAKALKPSSTSSIRCWKVVGAPFSLEGMARN